MTGVLTLEQVRIGATLTLPTIAIIGLGAIGSVLAAALTEQGTHTLTLCTRRPLAPFTVHAPGRDIAIDAPNLTDPAHATPHDWVIVATKTYDAASAATWFPTLCGPHTRVAIVQNGVEHRALFTPFLAAEAILPVIIDTPAERRPDGSILQRLEADMKVADTPAGHAFAALFPATLVQPVPDFNTAAWRKLCVNASGIVSALTLQPAGILRQGTWRRIGRDLVEECAAVARAEGAVIERNLAEHILERDAARPPESVNSMLADRLAGRQTEVEARNGVIVRLGEKHGIPTPANRLATALIHFGAPA